MDEVPAAPDAPAQAQQSRIGHYINSFNQLFVTLVEMTYTRLELIFVELQEWVEGVVGIVLWGVVAIFAAGASLLLGSLALIFAFWDTHRILVSLLVMAGFLLVLIAASWVIVVKLRAQRTLFAATLSEFAKDRELLKRRQ